MLTNVHLVVLSVTVHVCQPDSAWLLFDSIGDCLGRTLIDKKWDAFVVRRLFEKPC
jgi:hypothetical protein